MPTKYLVTQMVKDNTLTKRCHATKSEPPAGVESAAPNRNSIKAAPLPFDEFPHIKMWALCVIFRKQSTWVLFSQHRISGTCALNNYEENFVTFSQCFDSQALTGRTHFKAAVWFISLLWLLGPFKWETLRGIMFTDILLKTACVQRAHTLVHYINYIGRGEPSSLCKQRTHAK